MGVCAGILALLPGHCYANSGWNDIASTGFDTGKDKFRRHGLTGAELANELPSFYVPM